MRLNNFAPFISSLIHSTAAKSTVLIKDQIGNLIEVPQRWIDDIKHIEFNELLASSIGPLALYFGWRKRHKEEFSELASGILASSYIHGEPYQFVKNEK